MSEIGETELRHEIEEDICRIESIFGECPVGMAYPVGSFHEGVMQTAANFGLQYGRETHSTHSFMQQEQLLGFQPTCHHDDEELFALTDRFLAMQPKNLVFFMFGAIATNWRAIVIGIDMNAFWRRSAEERISVTEQIVIF